MKARSAALAAILLLLADARLSAASDADAAAAVAVAAAAADAAASAAAAADAAADAALAAADMVGGDAGAGGAKIFAPKPKIIGFSEVSCGTTTRAQASEHTMTYKYYDGSKYFKKHGALRAVCASCNPSSCPSLSFAYGLSSPLVTYGSLVSPAPTCLSLADGERITSVSFACRYFLEALRFNTTAGQAFAAGANPANLTLVDAPPPGGAAGAYVAGFKVFWGSFESDPEDELLVDGFQVVWAQDPPPQ
ncbi:MAG: hypothetical protein J3K34DRAFT_483539 [Monoraphidium minutum]|nr:MAG: hypothetical protein J3K34DRAFT_483539 [Monoraphidium minutum]